MDLLYRFAARQAQGKVDASSSSDQAVILTTENLSALMLLPACQARLAFDDEISYFLVRDVHSSLRHSIR